MGDTGWGMNNSGSSHCKQYILRESKVVQNLNVNRGPSLEWGKDILN